jgi:hypothetical protein
MEKINATYLKMLVKKGQTNYYDNSPGYVKLDDCIYGFTFALDREIPDYLEKCTNAEHKKCLAYLKPIQKR